MNRKKLGVLLFLLAFLVAIAVVVTLVVVLRNGNRSVLDRTVIKICDQPRNELLPFCDTSSPIDTRVQDLITRLTVQEKIGLLVNRAAGASVNVALDPYNWWNEALHGVGQSQTPNNPNLGTYFRPPTEHSTVFPQIISLSASFDRDLYFQMANATGNEARAFYNAGNSGLTFWSPNINIYRDPRWGRGQETPGEDPYLSAEFARMFILGLQGDEEKTGFIKASACCKHFAAHSIEENRHSFDAVVTEQDMADTYLPAFKTCVDNKVSSIMTAYSAINGVPATAHKHFITNIIREQWGFDGYIVSDCDAVDDVIYNHNYTQTESETCHAVLDAGVDIECGSFYTKFLQEAVTEGLVTEELMDTALSRGFRVLMRLGYFEKEDTRPFKEFMPEDIDTVPHKQLSLEAARRSIVLLKNNINVLTSLPLLPLNAQDFGPSGASMALIGPHLNADVAFLGVYHGIPSSIKVPLDEIQRYITDLRWERGCEINSFDNANVSEAEVLANSSSQVVLFVGINSEIEAEFGDRPDISLTGLQPELISRVLDAAQQPVILFVVSGGAIDLAAYKNDPRVGAIVWAGYIGQSGGEAIADVLFGNYNPSGRLTQTFYDSEYLDQVTKQDMNMRPVDGSPGRTYRFYTGEPVYPFGYGLSYTTFEYTLLSRNEVRISQFADECLETGLEVRNVGQKSGDHSVVWFLAPPNAGEAGRPIKNLVDFEKLHDVQPSESKRVQICLRSRMFELADENGEFELIEGEWKLMVGDETRSIFITRGNTCDQPRNTLLPFCDTSSPIDTRVQDLVSRLTIQEKIGLLVNRAAGASVNVVLDPYNWWNEALHGVGQSQTPNNPNLGTYFRPPTEHSTVFPQIISLSASFDRDLYFQMANATGNEARAFYNAGNSGLTFWSPNINIYRDPRWGRGQETPGEDPYLSAEFARMFILGLQGDEEKTGFIKASACCKHFAAHSIEENRHSFDAVVTEQDMADTYLPAFKTCVDNKVSSIMTAYSAINGVPATAHKHFITNIIREQWGFDGYIVSDCDAVDDVIYNHNYTQTESETCHAVLDAGVDIECGSFYTKFLQEAVTEGLVTEELMDTALSRGFRVLMRLGYFEKEDTRPFKEFMPEDIDTVPHKLLSLEAARRSIVLLKNNINVLTSLPLLPLNAQDFGASGDSMALIGPHLNADVAFLGVYHGIPSSIKVPLDEIQSYVPDLRWQLGCEVDSLDSTGLSGAEELARTSSQVVLFVGINSEIEAEFGDRPDISLTGLQPELISRVLEAAQRPVILFVVSGGAIDLSEYKNDPRVGAIVWAGYIGQSGGEAIADVLFGNYNPSGRLTQTFYDSAYLDQVTKQDMNMRPVDGSPGRTYRFYTGEPVYPFGYGLSYTTFEYTFLSEDEIIISQFADECLELGLEVRNVGPRSGDHSVLWFLTPPNAGEAGRPIKNLVDFEKLHDVLPSESAQIQICLRSSMFQLADENGEFELIEGEWKLMVGDETRSIFITRGNTCDQPRNTLLPFCDTSSPIDTRVQDLVGRLTVQEKIGLLVNRAAGASENVELYDYNWWNEALHGVANDIYPNLGTYFRPPTEYSTVFPQIISLSTSFERDLFLRMANATGNEARAFYNAGNAGLTFWSPNINIYRDPRWGRGQETPGEDPYLNSEYARMFITGLQGDEAKEGFLKASACCKHFAAHSIEEDRNSFNAIVNEQDMADTYLPAFKVCVENNVTSIMTAYSAINGIPATAHKRYITDVIREQWGFDGYIVSDCGAVDDVFYRHNYTETESDTCHAVLDAGVDIECGSFYTKFLQGAVTEGLVTEAMMDTALSRGFRVLMRLGYFEKDDTRPFKDLLPEDIDSQPHKDLSLEAAQKSIVLLKNNINDLTSLPLLPLDQDDFGPSLDSMALIGPHLNGSVVFLGNYHGIPSSIKVPLDEIQSYVPDLRWQLGCEVDSLDSTGLSGAEELARTSSQVVLFVGINSEIEAEFGDRPDISLTGLQPELISRVLEAAQRPVILFVVSGGAIDLSEYKNDPRVGAIVWAGYIGQSGGEAIADVLFGNYNPSGRLTQTFYDSAYLDQVTKQDMNMRPVDGSPGRTYRFYTGEPVYPFGYGLSYTTFEYTFLSEDEIIISQFADECLELGLEVRNVGPRSGDHSVLWFLTPPNAGEAGRPIKNLVDFEKLHDVLPSESAQIQICLRSSMFQLADENGEFELIEGEWKLMVGDETRSIFITRGNTCDQPRNTLLPFCDTSSPIDTRVQDLVGRLTVQEKIGLLVNRAAGASENVELYDYNWWNEALHGVANDIYPNLGTYFRPPTEYSTVFPQIISLSTSFERDLFLRMANATGNEARAFYNAGNAGLTFWSPNINIYRDPRWGRGQETPGEDPYLNSEYARMFITGLQGDEAKEGFLKASACCKHFAAHSIEEDRNSFNAIVNEQDMADTYLPAFKVCVENNVTSIMTAYSAINGIPATAHKRYITDVIREQWGFDGYIVSDCGAVDDVFYRHNYTETESDTCHAVLDAGVDIECGSFYTKFLQGAVTEGLVTEAMMDTALSRGFRVLMRLGYFEKDDTRPFKDLLPEDIDSQPHKDLSLEAAQKSIVLLKNNINDLTSLPLLPLDQDDFGPSLDSMALIGPHLNGSVVFLGNYHGIPSSIKVPLDEIQSYVPDLRWQLGCEVDSLDSTGLSGAEELARTSSQVVLFVGINSEIEAEFGDRPDISLTGLQPELISRVLEAAQRPVILFVVSGGAIDLSEYKNDPRVGAIVWAGYIGQSGGEAIADVLFGNYNPSGRLTQTFYDSAFLDQVTKQDMNMRPVDGSPGRTYRFYTGEPVYPFGYGLSYTTFEYTFLSEDEIIISQFADECLELGLEVRNVGPRSGDHSVLWFLTPPNAGEAGRPIKNLVDFEKLHDVLPSESAQIQICLRSSMFQLADENGEFELIEGEWKLMVGDETRSIFITRGNTCDQPRNTLLPFCDTSSPIDTRVQDLVGRLTVQEKIGLLVNRAAGASENVELYDYNWWNEALHGVANDIYPNLGTYFRPPTEYSTVFPQIISLSTSFERDLFLRMANATGNEARAFYNAGNAGLTFWSPNINIYRDPRWGRGQETPGEDPYLNSEYARMFITGLQGDEAKEGFLKASACCKHFAAHSIEEDRNSFNAIVNEQDMADTYLPAFKVCVENNVTSIMTAYSAINGIPATAHKRYITDVIREQWGFDGYIVSDCGAVDDVFYRHNYTETESDTCHAVLDAGVDIECGSFYTKFLQGAVTEGLVTEAMMDTALSRGFRVLMRLGYFEKDDTRPFKDLLPEDIDSQPHKDLSLEAAQKSIVLLKNNINDLTSLPLLPLDQDDFGPSLDSMALIGPHLNGSVVFLGNYHGIPSSIKVPLDEIQSYVPDLRWQLGCEVDSLDSTGLSGAEELARTSSQVVLFVGINSEIEAEFGDRPDISLTGLQPELISRVLEAAQRPVILFVVSGGAIDLSEYKNDPRVGAIVWAGYIGQSGGEAIADVLFGNYNPSGRLTQTFYDSAYLDQVTKQDMNMRPVDGSPGRTYRFYTGEPVYPFGYGLSYTTFEYTFLSEDEIIISQFADECLELGLEVRNVGPRSGDHSVLWFLTPPNAGEAGRPIKNLVDFEKLHDVLPSESAQIQICLRSSMFQLADENGEFELIEGEWKLMVGDETRSIFITRGNTCDQPRNTLLPFCDTSSPIDTRVQDLVGRLTVQEKIGLLVNRAAGASENVELYDYNWWNEALHGVANDIYPNLGTYFRPPTEYSTVFPQIISLSTSFERDLFLRMANATGNEARAFYNAGNAGLTFWSPNINIYRDPRWGRGQETPGEDPYLNSEYARMFITGLQGDEAKEGFLKASACCKHFAAHSIEEDRNSFNAIVNEQDMADTYLPAFKVCVENNVTSIMTAYSAINGIPATAHKRYITDVIREQWGFDGYIVSDCGAVDDVFYRHNYTETESDTCHAVLDAGVDIECGSFYTKFLQGAVTEGLVTEAMMDTALSRGFRVLMRLGYFEKDDTRPFKDLLPEDIDSQPHKDLSLEAAQKSIVLLKNNINDLTSLPLLPLDQDDFGPSLDSMALIGPHLNGSVVFLGNYHGIPSSIKVPLDEIQSYVPDLRWQLGCEVDSLDSTGLSGAEELARTSSQVVLFVGINSEIEAEFGDRPDISLTGLQPELISRVLEAAQRPVILFVVSGGAIDLSEYKNDPRVGAIVWAGYIGQSGGEAIADVLFGNYNPSGRLTQTFYDSAFLDQVTKQDMNMRPVDGSPGRTYRFYTGEPVYPFGYGLSYTTFEYTFLSEDEIIISQFADECLELGLEVRNVGPRSGDHSVLWFLTPPNAGEAGRPIKNLVDFEKLHDVLPSESAQIQICLRSSMFQLADENGEFELIEGEWKLMVGDETRSIFITRGNTCDQPRNTLLPFCDTSSPIDTRVQDLVGRLTVQEKIGLLVNRAAGASENVELYDYNWWNEALHGVANDIYPNLGTYFRPPTEYSTVFPQIISLSTSFERDLFLRMANATGNEARAFYNAGNAGLTFWSPNINIYRDPRWGRGQETPGEDPYLNSEYARMFITGLQGDEAKEGFLKASACCKHFAAHSIEEDRNSFNAIVNEQDMADTYLPAFKVCVENNVTSIMTAYSAINGIPATAHKRYITDVIREQWGFDGYIVSDCGAVDDVFYRHNYTETESDTCHAVLDAGVDIECGSFYTKFLQGAVTEGLVTEAMMDTALSRGFRVLMRLGYFEKDDTRPFKDLLPEDIDSQPHKDLSLEAAQKSIVLLKNNINDLTSLPLLPLDQDDFGPSLDSMALIGPHLNGSVVFLGNYHGIPSSIKVPLDEIQSYVPDLRWQLGCEVDSLDSTGLSGAEELARTSSQVVLFVGINSEIEAEFGDRPDISLTGLQPELISRVLEAAQRPVILFVVSGGAIDLSEYKNDPRVGAIVWAGYIGQSGGEAIADVLFGNYNPSGRLTQTLYDSAYLDQVTKQDMNMRPVDGSPGRTYRFYTGEPVYPFGYGLSYTTFEYTFLSEDEIIISQFADECLELGLEVSNVGPRSGDHSVLWFLTPPNAGEAGRPMKNLVDFEKLHDVLPSESAQIQICLRSSMFQLADENGEFEVILGEWKLMVGDQTRNVVVS